MMPLDHEALWDGLPLALLVVDSGYRVHYANAATEQILNASSALVQGKELSEILVLNAEWKALLAQAEAHHEAKGYNLPLQTHKRGELGRAHVHIAGCQPFREQEIPGKMLILEPCEVSEKLGSHASRRDAMRSAAVMAEILAHEVRNPLSGIKGAAQLLRDAVSRQGDRELLALICSEVERLSNLIGQVEYFSTEQKPAMEAVNIHEVLRYVCELAKKGVATGIPIAESYDPSLPLVYANRELLVQALLNLVKNASEAVLNTKKPSIFLKTFSRSGYRLSVPELKKPVSLPICIQVGDNGPGIPDMLRANIFDPFVTSKPSGKGLGLAIVSKIIADHGGVIALESSEMNNTVFSLHLPACNEH